MCAAALPKPCLDALPHPGLRRERGHRCDPAAGSAAPGRWNRARGPHPHRQFLGHVDLVDVAVEGLDFPLKGRLLRDAIPPVNDDLRLEFDPAEVLVFAASEA